VIEQLGAVVYRPKESDGLDWSCLAASDDIRREIEDTVLLPLKHPEVYEGVFGGW
jgi:hypothetical protein